MHGFLNIESLDKSFIMGYTSYYEDKSYFICIIDDVCMIL